MSSADKFNAVMEAAPLSEVEISQYCRIKGIYLEQIQQWYEVCQNASILSDLKPSARRQLNNDESKNWSAS
ncbi:hypothetical protein [Pseudomonas sp. A-B-19]|uniref:hypothetical protein n=1 Tax=Pseudomonas sp. A-B-19 TaxID=2832405 RepID=UPI001CBE83B7|nr:hypothetical protein [Pseudomonas sp. A-B-19]